jgi:hypothetical protein
MSIKKRFAIYAFALVALAGCDTTLQDWSRDIFHKELPPPPPFDYGPSAVKVFKVADKPQKIYGEWVMRAGEIYWDDVENVLLVGKFPNYSAYPEKHNLNPASPDFEPAYQVLKDFLLLPGAEPNDTISFENGKITYFCKYGPLDGILGPYIPTAPLEIVIGTGHGTTPGTGELDPSLFAKRVTLAGNDINANGGIKVSGANLASGTVLTLLGEYAAVTYEIYGTTYTTVVPHNQTYIYP